VCPTPVKVIRAWLAHCRYDLLVQWTGQATSDASWIELDEPVQLEDELNLHGGRDVMVGLQYSRRAKQNRVQGSGEQRTEAGGAAPA
jgi:hypothetical protein